MKNPFKMIDTKFVKVLEIKKDKKTVGNIAFYRENENASIDDFFDLNLLETIREEYPASTLETHVLKTDNEQKQFETIFIKKFSKRHVNVHFIQDLGMPDSSFGVSGKSYPSKKIAFNINISTVDEEFLKHLKDEYEVLIPFSDGNEELFKTIKPLL